MFSLDLNQPTLLATQESLLKLSNVHISQPILYATYTKENANKNSVPTEVILYLAYLASQNSSVKSIQINFIEKTEKALSLSFSSITGITAPVAPQVPILKSWWPEILALFAEAREIQDEARIATNSAQLGKMGASFISSATFTAGVAIVLLTAFPPAVIAAPFIGAAHFGITYWVNQRQTSKRAAQIELNLTQELAGYEAREKEEQETHHKIKQNSRVLSFVLLALGTLGALAGLAAAPFTFGLSAVATFGIFAAIGTTAMLGAFGLQLFIDKQDEKLAAEKEKSKIWHKSYFLLRAIMDMDEAASTLNKPEQIEAAKKIASLRELRKTWYENQKALIKLEKELESGELTAKGQEHTLSEIENLRLSIPNTETIFKTTITELNALIQNSSSPEAKTKAANAANAVNYVFPPQSLGLQTSQEYIDQSHVATGAIKEMHRAGQVSAIAQGVTTGVVVGASVFAATALGLFASILTSSSIAAMGFGVIAALGASTFGIGAIVGCAVLAVGIGIAIGYKIYKQRHAENQKAEEKLSSQIRPTNQQEAAVKSALSSPSPSPSSSLLSVPSNKPTTTLTHTSEPPTKFSQLSSKAGNFLTSDLGVCLMFGVATLVSGALFGGIFGLAAAAAATLVLVSVVGVCKYVNYRKKCKAEEKIRELKKIEAQDLAKENSTKAELEPAKSPSPTPVATPKSSADLTHTTTEHQETPLTPPPTYTHPHHSQPTLFHNEAPPHAEPKTGSLLTNNTPKSPTPTSIPV
ncbi:MAG: hypothetical protein WCW01_06810 [Gammaproteobacteria bacterium]